MNFWILCVFVCAFVWVLVSCEYRNEIKDLGEKYSNLEARLKDEISLKEKGEELLRQQLENERDDVNKEMQRMKQETEQLRLEITNVKHKFKDIENKNISMLQITSEKK